MLWSDKEGETETNMTPLTRTGVPNLALAQGLNLFQYLDMLISFWQRQLWLIGNILMKMYTQFISDSHG